MEARLVQVTAGDQQSAVEVAVRLLRRSAFDPLRLLSVRKTREGWSVRMAGNSLDENEGRALWGDR